MSQKSRRIISTCDDCGLSEGINEAALKLHLSGMVSTASVMANVGATEHALRLFADYPSMQVGIHLNLTTGYPLTTISSPSPITEPDGRFRGKWGMFTRAFLPSNRFLTLVEAELTKQMETFTEFGNGPTHITTHLQFHLVPELRRIVFRLARTYGINWIRSYDVRSVVAPANPMLLMRPQSTKGNQPVTPDYLVVVQMWMRRAPEELVSRIMELEGNVELVVHPCFMGDVTFPYDIDSHTPTERFIEMSYFRQVFLFLKSRDEHLKVCDLATQPS